MPKIKGIKKQKMFAFFSPDGEIQVRSIAYKLKDSKEYLCFREWHTDGTHVTWEDYTKKGFVYRKILVDIKIA